jgi:uncharacterized protein
MPIYNLAKKNSLKLTTIIILINVILFAIIYPLLIIGKIPIQFIALSPTYALNYLYLFTFLTSMFMHGSIFHLFVNMLSLFFLGNLLETIIGKKRFLWFYLISGIFAGIFFVLISLLFNTGINTFAVGASGALFGLVGLLMLLLPDLRVYIMFIPIPIKLKYAAPGLLIVLWLISITPMIFGGQQIPIGNTAHLGGLIAGLAYGFYLRKKFKNKIKSLQQYFK